MIPVSIAPMMDWTDRHYRYMMRRITRRTLLYTEMITSAAIVHGDRDRLLAFHSDEHPLSLQLGGDDPEEIARAIGIAERYDYDQYNLNVGCPSDRVQSGRFGACLMATPHRVAAIVSAMQGATNKPVTVKHRIGIDDLERYEDMLRFVDVVAAAGVTRFTVHARIAILQGLDPKENRNIPPIRYDDVYRLKRERPELEIELNGQVKTIEQIRRHLEVVDAVMLGRAAYETPWLLATVDEEFFDDPPGEPPGEPVSREGVVYAMLPYLREQTDAGTPPRRIINHMLGLFAGRPGARRWKQALSGRLPQLPPEEIILSALDRVPPEVRAEIATSPRRSGIV